MSDEAYYQWVEEQWSKAFDDATDEVARVLRDFGVTYDRSAIREVIEEAHQADDPEWRFNLTYLFDRVVSHTDMVDLDNEKYNELYDKFEDIFPVRP